MTTRIASASLIQRHRTPTPPSVRTSFGNAAQGTSVSTTIPAAAQIGDLAIVVTNTDPTNTINTPVGWTLRGRRSNEGTAAGQTQTSIFTKTLVSGDPGSAVSWARPSGSAPIAVAGVVVQGVDPDGFHLAMGRNALAANPTGQRALAPAVRPSPQDLVLALGTARAFASMANTASRVATPPAGFTLRQNQSAAYALGQHYAAWVMDGPASAAGADATVTLGDQSYMAAATILLSPVGQWPTIRTPKTLTGKPLRFYTTSAYAYVAGASSHIAETPAPVRLSQRIGPSALGWYSLPGSFASDIAGYVAGTVSYNTQALQSDTNFTVPQAGGWAPMADKSGLVVVDCIGNDALNHNNTAGSSTNAKALAGARNAAESIVRILRSNLFVGAGDPVFTYTGSWTYNAGNDVIGGGTMSAGPGASITFPVTVDAVDLWLTALDDANLTAGASYEVRVNGTAVATGTTSNQMRRSTFSAYNRAPYCPLPVPLEGLTGTSTITVTNTGGGTLFFMGVTARNPDPPWIILNRLPRWNPATLTTVGVDQAAVDTYSGIIQTVAGLFPDGKVIAYNPLESGLWDHTTMVGSFDNIHYNDAGMAHFATETARWLSERVP